MKKSLVLALIMVSVTALAENTMTLDCSTKEVAKGFTGRIKVTTQADEVVFADSYLSANGELLTLENMHGMQRNVPEQNITLIQLSSDEESQGQKAGLYMRLGTDEHNTILKVGEDKMYASRCEVVGMTGVNPYEVLIQKLSK